MSTEHSGSGGKVSPAATVDGHEAEMTYSRASAKLIIIDHTEVPDALREAFKIIPLCPFAKAQFERHAEWRDVLSG